MIAKTQTVGEKGLHERFRMLLSDIEATAATTEPCYRNELERSDIS